MKKKTETIFCELLKHIKKECPTKSIWVYSSFLYEEIMEWKQPLLDYVDVLVDGPFVNEFQKMRISNSEVLLIKELLI